MYPECLSCGGTITPGVNKFVVFKGEIVGTTFRAESAEGYLCEGCLEIIRDSNPDLPSEDEINNMEEALDSIDIPGESLAERVENLCREHKLMLERPAQDLPIDIHL